MEKGYNGWKNRETWNVMLWIGNDEPLYKEARHFVRHHHKGGSGVYKDFINTYGIQGKTPDGVDWLDDNLDYPRLDEAMQELGE